MAEVVDELVRTGDFSSVFRDVGPEEADADA
ncbi:hypothetical protein SAMN02745830_03078 [Streptomyces sp. Amel2xC10]|nr:hypothetical protein SAMN02745830_03078 [Streptomyces sp. Amel2xC10]